MVALKVTSLYNLSFYSVGVIGSVSVDMIIIVDMAIGCVFWFVRHFIVIVLVLGVIAIDEMYVSRRYTYRLSRDAMAIIVASVVMLNMTILFRISHFGMKPVRGGSPPIDRIVIVSIDASCGDVIHVVPMSLIVVDDVVWSMRKTGVVDRM